MDMLATMLRESLVTNNISQTKMASYLHTSQQNVSEYVLGKKMIPGDQIIVWAMRTRSHELIHEWLHAMNLREDGHLNNVNLEPLHVAAKWLEESREAENALSELLPSLVNRTKPEHFDCERIKKQVEDVLSEVYDVEVASKYLRISFDKVNFSLKETEKRHQVKMVSKGYRVRSKRELSFSR